MTTRQHPQLIEPVRHLLITTGRPWVIENVVGAPLQDPLMLCGSMFGLQTDCGAHLRRHRLFESNCLLMSPGDCRHGKTTIAVQGHQAYNEAARMAERRRTISVCGDTPHDPATWRAAQRGMRTISITSHTANNPATENHGRTIMVVGQKPKDPAAERRNRQERTIRVTESTPQRGERTYDGRTVLTVERETFTVAEARIAMGINGMTMKELSQAIPPAYTQWIGEQLILFVER